MDAQEFMQLHADNAVAGKMAEVIKDLTPESMAQVGPLMAAGPAKATSNKVVAVGQEADGHIFDVTYTGDDGKSATMRETVKQVDGVWKIVNLTAPK